MGLNYDVEAYLKQFTAEQYVIAYINILRDYDIKMIPVNMMKTGFALAGPDGWQMVAPHWMKPFETEGIKPLEEFRNNGPDN